MSTQTGTRKRGSYAMKGRSELVATRVTPDQKDLIVALARLEGRTVTSLLFDLVVPVVKERLEQRLAAVEVSE